MKVRDLISIFGTIAVIVLLIFVFYFAYNKNTSRESIQTDISQSEVDLMDGFAVFPQAGIVAPADFPLEIQGTARGPWFFEGDFPMWVELESGEVVARGVAAATGEWMTERPVPFYGVLIKEETATKYTGSATLILQNDNPSALKENSAIFKTSIQIKI